MSDSFCQFVPEDPSCQTDAGGDNDNVDKSMKMEDDMDDDMMKPMMGNLTYLHVAMWGVIHGGLELFRYHEDTHYDAGDVMSPNLWKLTGELTHYSHFAISLILTCTQILSMVGIAGEINIMAWMYVHMLEIVLSTIV